MADADVDMTGSGPIEGQGSPGQGVAGGLGLGPGVDRDRRAPRFSWTPAYETTFFQSLCESVQLGLRENSSFKAEAWDRAAQALQAKHGAAPTKNHLINKSDNARKRFRLWRGLREDPDFVYDPVAKTVTATEEAWRAHIEREPLSRALRGRPFDHEEYMEILYPDVVGSGGAPKRVMKPRRRTDGQLSDETDMPGTGVLNLQGEHPSHPHSLQASASNSPLQQRPSLSQTPSGSSTGSGGSVVSGSSSGSVPHPRTSLSLPPRTATGGNPSALTPPDECHPPHSGGSVRQSLAGVMGRPFDGPMPGSSSGTPDPIHLQAPPLTSPEKRRRISDYGSSVSGAAAPATASIPSPPVNKPVANGHTHQQPQQPQPPFDAATLKALETQLLKSSPLLEELASTLRNRNGGGGGGGDKWREEALDAFFREFAGEDLDLQVKVAEEVLSDEHRAMAFCKMPARVRQHWVRRLREQGRSLR